MFENFALKLFEDVTPLSITLMIVFCFVGGIWLFVGIRTYFSPETGPATRCESRTDVRVALGVVLAGVFVGFFPTIFMITITIAGAITLVVLVTLGCGILLFGEKILRKFRSKQNQYNDSEEN